MNRDALYATARAKLRDATTYKSIKADDETPMKAVVDAVLDALPVAGYMAFARTEDGSLYPLPDYTGRTIECVEARVLTVARRQEGYTGAAAPWLKELDWVILPIFRAPPGQT